MLAKIRHHKIKRHGILQVVGLNYTHFTQIWKIKLAGCHLLFTNFPPNLRTARYNVPSLSLFWLLAASAIHCVVRLLLCLKLECDDQFRQLIWVLSLSWHLWAYWVVHSSVCCVLVFWNETPALGQWQESLSHRSHQGNKEDHGLGSLLLIWLKWDSGHLSVVN